MDKVVTIREFTRNIYSYIKERGEFVITIKGSKKIRVTLENYAAAQENKR